MGKLKFLIHRLAWLVIEPETAPCFHDVTLSEISFIIKTLFQDIWNSWTYLRPGIETQKLPGNLLSRASLSRHSELE